ncbi:MAG TPA: winged helix-turn-helix domain-containing protein [Kofleriaceae bacterium]|nr:winged helix-turn-helix domain-containing protein [Kofleriaceae bacterium]
MIDGPRAAGTTIHTGKERTMSTLAVVEKILRETRVPMSVREIVETAGSALPTRSKTPDTVVARDLSMDIKRKGDTSLFVRTAPGRYTLREIQAAAGKGAEVMAPVSSADMVAAIAKERAGTKPAAVAPRPASLQERQPG